LVTVVADSGQQSQNADQVVVNPVGVGPQVVEYPGKDIAVFAPAAQGQGLFADRQVVVGGLEGIFPARQADTELDVGKCDQKSRDQDGGFHCVAALSGIQVRLIQADIGSKQLFEKQVLPDRVGRVHPTRG